MNGSTFLFLILVGVGLDRLWLGRYAVLDALVAAVDWLSTDPAPPEPIAPARPCVRLVRPGDDGPWGGGEAA
jgi:hypothetical protein